MSSNPATGETEAGLVADLRTLLASGSCLCSSAHTEWEGFERLLDRLEAAEAALAAALAPTTLKAFHHTRAGRVCVYRPIPPGNRRTWCYRSDLTDKWMPCASPHPPAGVTNVPIDPRQP